VCYLYNLLQGKDCGAGEEQTGVRGVTVISASFDRVDRSRLSTVSVCERCSATDRVREVEGMNWEAEKDMDRDVRENRELYEALAASYGDEE
jgi:hypothetical protein